MAFPGSGVDNWEKPITARSVYIRLCAMVKIMLPSVSVCFCHKAGLTINPDARKLVFQSVAGYDNDMVQHFKDTFGPLLAGEDVARAILYIVNQPPHVHISDIIVRPTRQEYP